MTEFVYLPIEKLWINLVRIREVEVFKNGTLRIYYGNEENDVAARTDVNDLEDIAVFTEVLKLHQVGTR